MNLNDLSLKIKTHFPQVEYVKILVTYEMDSRTGSYHDFDHYELLTKNQEVYVEGRELNSTSDKVTDEMVKEFAGVKSMLKDEFSNDGYIDSVNWNDEDEEEGSLIFDLTWELLEEE